MVKSGNEKSHSRLLNNTLVTDESIRIDLYIQPKQDRARAWFTPGEMPPVVVYEELREIDWLID